jgi:hypothetical protein
VYKLVSIVMPGDGRETANREVAPKAQEALQRLTACLGQLGCDVDVPHRGLISSQKMSADTFGKLKGDAIIALYTGWTFGGHLTHGLTGKNHQDKPVLLLSNFLGDYPGLVGLLNHSASLRFFGREHSKLWTNGWQGDERFMSKLSEFAETGAVTWDVGRYLHSKVETTPEQRSLGEGVAERILTERRLALMCGVCSMQMFNGLFPLDLVNRVGFGVEICDQAELLRRAKLVPEKEAEEGLRFCRDNGAIFHFGSDPATELTEDQVKKQFQMMKAALGLIEEFGADCGGVQYQLGLIESWPSTDLWEGLLNNRFRPWGNGGTMVWVTEADFGNLIPQQILKEILLAKGMAPEVYFHDVRWGDDVSGEFVWVLENSGSVAPYFFNKRDDTLEGMHVFRQPPMYFAQGGGTCAGVTLPGEMTWARAYVEGGQMKMVAGTQECLRLPDDELERLWQGTDRTWPIAGVKKQVPPEVIMADFPSNHEAGCYGDVLPEFTSCCEALGIPVTVYRD